ncbi:MAG: hypothetical protein H6739_39570 [Alphaproteobacteria bacterium]|nr:hypothetical protein [Alphaproteobacteria bacterium]
MSGSLELVRVQRLHLKLLYCERTAQAFAEDPEAVLALWRVPSHWSACLPDPLSEGHRAEMHGRRLLAAQDLEMVFAATLRHLGARDAREALGQRWLSAFLSSDAFFEPRFSLPDPVGVGRAYEGYSRFFFWARDAFGLRRPGADEGLRDDLYLDFAACLDQRKVTALDPAWDALQSGFFWSVRPGHPSPCRGLTRDREVFTDRRPDARERLLAEGLLDLDGLEP